MRSGSVGPRSRPGSGSGRRLSQRSARPRLAEARSRRRAAGWGSAEPIAIVCAESGHADAWARLRAGLWADSSVAEHRVEIDVALAAFDPDHIAFVAIDGTGEVVGFAEAALRRDYVNGCDTSPVAFLEGIHVIPAHQRTGVARSLCQAVEQWGLAVGCTELGSDAEIGNVASHAFHEAIGFEETERVVFFRKALPRMSIEQE